MSIDVGRALRAGAGDLTSARGAILYVLFAVFSIVSLPVHQTLSRELIDWMITTADLSPSEVPIPATPLAIDVGLPVLAGTMVVIFLVAEGLRFVAVRAFASEASTAIPVGEITENLLPRFLVLLVASLVVQMLVFGGLLMLVIPGVIAMVLVVFVRQAVLLDDAGVIESVKRSASLVLDNPLQVLAILVALIVISYVVGFPSLLFPADSIISPITGALLGTLTTLYGVAVVTEAYLQVRDGDDEAATSALGPDDLDGEFQNDENEPTA